MWSQVGLRKAYYKASGGEKISVELIKILKDGAVKVLHSMYQQIWKTHLWPQNWETSVFISIQKKGNVKECSNYCKLILAPLRLYSKSFKSCFNSKWTGNFQMYKLRIEEAEEPEIKLSTSGRSQDDRGIGRGDHFLFYKFIERTTERWTKFTKQLLIASSRHQVPRIAAHCLRREVGQKY